MIDLPDKKIILFDGVCNLCDSVVQEIIRRDKKDVFRFVALQSELGKEIVEHLAIDSSKTDSIILYEPGKAYYYKSDAALEIAKTLGGTANLALAAKILPAFLRNSLYDFIARNRYKWYGKKEQCLIHTPELKAKFLD